MPSRSIGRMVGWIAGLALSAALVGITGCSHTSTGQAPAGADGAHAQVAGRPGEGQPVFASDDAAAQALIAAAKLHDRAEVRKVLGPATEELVELLGEGGFERDRGEIDADEVVITAPDHGGLERDGRPG